MYLIHQLILPTIETQPTTNLTWSMWSVPNHLLMEDWVVTVLPQLGTSQWTREFPLSPTQTPVEWSNEGLNPQWYWWIPWKLHENSMKFHRWTRRYPLEVRENWESFSPTVCLVGLLLLLRGKMQTWSNAEAVYVALQPLTSLKNRNEEKMKFLEVFFTSAWVARSFPSFLHVSWILPKFGIILLILVGSVDFRMT